jgi:phosphatidylserine decarboxylase
MVFENVCLAHTLWIKGRNFTLRRLLKSKTRAEYYKGASIVLCRLAPQDYHRFHFPVGGKYTVTRHIKGGYISVQPQVVRSKRDVLTENKRAVTYLRTRYFGKVAYVTIGATCVGSIVITAKANSRVRKGQEYGTFAYGGSTIVLLIPKGKGKGNRESKIFFSDDIVRNSLKRRETLIRMGEEIGFAS